MVDLVLDGLGHAARALDHARAEKLVVVADRNTLEAAGGARAGKRQAPLLGFVGAAPMDEARVQHHQDGAVVVDDGDDALALADHVGGHADAGRAVRLERVGQVARYLRIRARRLLARLAQEELLCHDGFDHVNGLSGLMIMGFIIFPARIEEANVPPVRASPLQSSPIRFRWLVEFHAGELRLRVPVEVVV